MTQRSLYVLVVILVLLNTGTALASGLLVSYYRAQKRASDVELADLRTQTAQLATMLDRVAEKADQLNEDQRQFAVEYKVRRRGLDLEPRPPLPFKTHPDVEFSERRGMGGMAVK